MKIVVKLGGELVTEARRSELAAICDDVAALAAAGHRLIVIHGGGPQTTALQERLGQTPHIVGGRRVTDDETLVAIEMVVGGQVNIELTSALRRVGLAAVGLNGVSARLIACEKRPPRVVSGGGPEPVDFGHVGDVTGVNHRLIQLLWDGGYLPVLACIGSDAAGRPFNINADVVANGVSVAVTADRLVLVTGAPGVLRDISDPESRIPRLTRKEARAAIDAGVVQAGMIPKLEESFRALDEGVGEIQIVGRLGPGDLRRGIERSGAVGTTLLRTGEGS